MLTLRYAVLLVLALTMPGLVSCAKPAQRIEVRDAWVRLTPPGSPMTAGYGSIRNTGQQPVTFSGFSSPQFGDVTLHYTEDVNGTARMREALNYSLNPGESLSLAPGGYHLMLMQRTAETPENSQVQVTFELESGQTYTHSFSVERR